MALMSNILLFNTPKSQSKMGILSRGLQSFIAIFISKKNFLIGIKTTKWNTFTLALTHYHTHAYKRACMHIHIHIHTRANLNTFKRAGWLAPFLGYIHHLGERALRV